MAIKVKLWTDRYAPGMIQARAVRVAVTRKIRGEVLANGGTWDNRGTALIDADTAGLTPAQVADLDNGWDVTIIIDADTFRTWYGYGGDRTGLSLEPSPSRRTRR